MDLLRDITVAELGGYITGPLCGMILAEMGANVIKIERSGGDPFRQFMGDSYSPQFQAYNRNKRSTVIDYDKDAGREDLLKLLSKSDVLISNNRPGILEKFG